MVLWTPALIDTALWLDAADEDTITLNGSNVSQWDDKSGEDRHVKQSNSSLQPEFSANGLDTNYPGLIFDGADRMVTDGNFPVTGNPAFSVFYVYKKTTASAGYVFGWGSPGPTALQAVGLYDDGSTRMYGFGGGNNFVVNSIANDTPIFASFQKSAGAIGTTSAAYQNGVSTAASGHSSNTPDIAARLLYIGQWTEFSPPFYLAGVVSEFIVIEENVSQGTREKLEGYLAHKWGLAGSLPSAHPYKDGPPVGLSYFGTVRDKDGNPASRTITVLDSTGQCVATGTSDPVTGEYDIEMLNDDPHTLVFTGEPDRNAIVYANVVPGEKPE